VQIVLAFRFAIAILESLKRNTKGNEMIAAYVGNKHAKVRVTPFYVTHQEARNAAVASGHLDTFTQECANWQEHQRWNRERVGMYAHSTVTD
jgi:hypothetical protein